MPIQALASDPHSTVSLFHKKPPFQKILMTSLQVISVWPRPPPPQIKNPGYPFVPRQCFFLTLIIFH